MIGGIGEDRNVCIQRIQDTELSEAREIEGDTKFLFLIFFFFFNIEHFSINQLLTVAERFRR